MTMKKTNNSQLILLWFSFVFLLFPATSMGEVIELTMPNGRVATAEFRDAEPEAPSVLVVHGFLATRNFQTVSRLSEALYDEGYTVLSPTLSLNVDKRKVSLPCEAIHTHTLEDDISELEMWVDWLRAKKKDQIILIGHSFGSITILSYALHNKKAPIKKLVAASLVVDENSLGEEIVKSQIDKARRRAEKGDKSLAEYKISYCKRYVSPPDAFLSYASWSSPKVINALSNVRVPIQVILGENDNRINPQWSNALKKSGVKVTTVEGANHFFDAEYEFDLLENVLHSLEESSIP